MYSRSIYDFAIPAGTLDLSPIISVPINGFIMNVPTSNNIYIKRIMCYIINISGTNDTEVIKFFNIRFRIINRDISIQRNLAGNILNPVSGPFNGSSPKDSIVDCMVSSKKNSIDFVTPILAGGIQFQTARIIFNSVTTNATNGRLTLIIQYDEQ